MSLLTAARLAKSYGADDIFSDISLSIPKNARIGLVGVNGVGKTTLLRVLRGEESPSAGEVSRARNLRIGYLPQEARLDASHTLWQECLFALEHLTGMQEQLHAMEAALAKNQADGDLLARYGELQARFEQQDGYTYEIHIERTLTGLGFERADFNKPIRLLSGGQRTRAVLARLLLSNPDLLLLDEPTNHLDIQAMEWLENYLKNWPGAVLLVSHDRYFLDQTVGVIWEMTPALEVYRGNYSAYLLQREERYERQLKEYEAQQEFIVREEDFIRRNIAGQNTRQAQGRRKRLEHLLNEARLAPPHSSRRIHFNLQAAQRSGDLVVRTYGLQVGYPDDGKVLIQVPDLVLRRGECTAVMGPNGAGKTTFLKTLLGNLKPLAGEVVIGASVRVGYFAQAHEGLHPSWTLLREIQHAAPQLMEAQAREYLAKFLFSGDDVFKEVKVLSGGERGRLALACLSLQGANLLLLDEPTNHLDLPSQEILQRILAEFSGTVLLITHDRYLVDAVATQIWEVQPHNRSLQIFEGNYSQYKTRVTESKGGDEIEPRVKNDPPLRQARRKPGGRISQRLLREMEARISALEEELAEVSQKLENPLEAIESVAELGRLYVQIKGQLDAEWENWNELFQEEE